MAPVAHEVARAPVLAIDWQLAWRRFARSDEGVLGRSDPGAGRRRRVPLRWSEVGLQEMQYSAVSLE